MWMIRTESAGQSLMPFLASPQRLALTSLERSVANQLRMERENHATPKMQENSLENRLNGAIKVENGISKGQVANVKHDQPRTGHGG